MAFKDAFVGLKFAVFSVKSIPVIVALMINPSLLVLWIVPLLVLYSQSQKMFIWKKNNQVPIANTEAAPTP